MLHFWTATRAILDRHRHDTTSAGEITAYGNATTTGGKLRVRRGGTVPGPAEYCIAPNASGVLAINDGADDLLCIDGSSNRIGILAAAPAETLDVAGQVRAGRNSVVLLTDDGGIAVKLVAGESLAKGDLVAVGSTVAGRVVKAAPDDDEPVGVVYTDLSGASTNIATGTALWVVIQGIARVNIDTAVSTGAWLRSSLSGGAPGKAASGPKDASTHWKEVGHALESGSAGGQVLALLSLN